MSEVWATKYRPRHLDDVVGQNEIVAEMRAIVLDEMPMQHYLFYSPEPGTGKTTMALALAKELGYQVVMFNASSKKQRGIEFIEETIIPATRSGVKERIFFLVTDYQRSVVGFYLAVKFARSRLFPKTIWLCV